MDLMDADLRNATPAARAILAEMKLARLRDMKRCALLPLSCIVPGVAVILPEGTTVREEGVSQRYGPCLKLHNPAWDYARELEEYPLSTLEASA